MAKKKKLSSFGASRKRNSIIFVSLFSIVTLSFGNWFAHQPTAWREKFGCFEGVCESLGALTANTTDSLGLTGTDACIPYQWAIEEGPLPFGVPKVCDATITPTDQQIICRKGYWVAWSPSFRVPLWSAYAVPVKKVVEHAGKRPNRFSQDTDAKYSSTHEDYTGSNYDRGHMAPNSVIATRYGREAQLETFYMSNIAPQKPDLNRNAWKNLEHIVANDLSELGETLWVITGIVPGGKHAVLPKGGIHIPKGFYKIIASVRNQQLYVLGVYMPQETKKSKHPRYCFRSIDVIEEMTGMDFFTALSIERQQALESIEPTRFWATGYFN
ncbi:MAG: DNA/RNA non-specific endonuclease [bacterium]|nr:DNA/RNA non-specific endonuclease [bacterium]